MRSGWRAHVESAVACAVVASPGLLAVTHALASPDAAHEMASLRVAGLGHTGAARALDALLAAPFVALPIGTESFRAAMAVALVASAEAAVLYGLARSLLHGVTGARSLLASAVAAIATLTATLSPAWQLESSVIGGASLGALLALLPTALLATSDAKKHGRLVAAAVSLGLALSYEPCVALLGVCGVAPFFTRAHRPPRSEVLRAAASFAIAAATPLAFAAARARASVFALPVSLRASVWSDVPLAPRASPIPFLHDQIGWLALLLAMAGAGLALVAAPSRRIAVSLTAQGIVATAAVAMGLASSASLVAIASLTTLAAVAMHRLVVLVAEAKVPFARASAAMVLLLELTFPVVQADDAALRADARFAFTMNAWDDVALSRLPARTLLLFEDPRVVRHLVASRARGASRGDLALIPLGDLAGRAALRELSRDADLAALFRDMTLRGAPGEFALASLAANRGVVIELDGTWERALARHVVPEGGVDRFGSEPHSGLERKRALDAFVPVRDAWLHRWEGPGGDPARALAASLLRARVRALDVAGERDLSARADADAKLFEAPNAAPRAAAPTALAQPAAPRGSGAPSR